MIELPTPETDDFILSQDYSPTGHQWRTFTRKLERERNSARAKFVAAIDGRDMANEEADKLRAQNAELCDIAERAIKLIPPEIYGEHSYAKGILRAELDQLKEEAK
jgi:hypothetical protein